MKTKILGILGCIVIACFLTGGLYGAQEWEWEGQVNINSAMEATLELLPGVDMETALNIIKFRESNGPFTTIDELKKVKGIDDAVLEQIRPYVSIEKETQLQYRQ